MLSSWPQNILKLRSKSYRTKWNNSVKDKGFIATKSLKFAYLDSLSLQNNYFFHIHIVNNREWGINENFDLKKFLLKSFTTSVFSSTSNETVRVTNFSAYDIDTLKLKRNVIHVKWRFSLFYLSKYYLIL